jgi:thiol-disulfide isomerase/thioredoxin
MRGWRLAASALLLISSALSHKAFAAEPMRVEAPSEDAKRTHYAALRDATLLAPDGTRYDLATTRAKLVWFNQWAHWCAPCIAELPVMKKLQDQVGRDRLEIILLSQPRDWNKDRAYAAAQRIDFPLLVMPDTTEDPALNAALRLGVVIEKDGERTVRTPIPLSTLLKPSGGDGFVYRGSHLDPEKIVAQWQRIHLLEFIETVLAQ